MMRDMMTPMSMDPMKTPMKDILPRQMFTMEIALPLNRPRVLEVYE